MNSLSQNPISGRLIKWYQKHHRDLPWRLTRNPYYIWLSEVILQQTRVDQGMAYYNRYVADYPTVKELAEAPEMEVMKRWQGLGYYSRARNLHAAAKMVMEDHNGVFPDSYEGLRALKGVGEYTASALASIAYNQPFAVVDGNVYRVLSRIYGIDTPIDTTEGRKIFALKAREILDIQQPGIHNQAVMELGAMVCKPAKPMCESCPVNEFCIAYARGLTSLLPVKSKKQITRDRYFNYLVFLNRGAVVMKKRGSGDIWQGLYDFPMIESKKIISPASLFKTNEWKSIAGDIRPVVTNVTYPVLHKLSHQVIHIRFIVMEVETALKKNLKGDFIWTKDVNRMPVPKPVENFLKTLVN